MPIIHKTKRTPTKSYKGGVIDYKPIKDELRILCKNPNVFVTTMFDYYGMPNNTPAIDHTDTDLYKRIEYIEQAITNDIGCNNLSFNLLVHEFAAFTNGELEDIAFDELGLRGVVGWHWVVLAVWANHDLTIKDALDNFTFWTIGNRTGGSSDNITIAEHRC